MKLRAKASPVLSILHIWFVLKPFCRMGNFLSQVKGGKTRLKEQLLQTSAAFMIEVCKSRLHWNFKSIFLAVNTCSPTYISSSTKPFRARGNICKCARDTKITTRPAQSNHRPINICPTLQPSLVSEATEHNPAILLYCAFNKPDPMRAFGVRQVT